MGKKSRGSISSSKKPGGDSKEKPYQGGNGDQGSPTAEGPANQAQGPEGSDTQGMPEPAAMEGGGAAGAAGGFFGGGLTSRGAAYTTQEQDNANAYPGTTNSAYQGPRSPDAAPLIAPVGGQMPRFSAGNAANGNINLGSILGSRPNPSYDPNNPGAALPYQSPGFLRRLFGDNGDVLNQQYATSRNATLLDQRQADANWQRQAQFLREQAQATHDAELMRARLAAETQAAGHNLSASTQASIANAGFANARALQEGQQGFQRSQTQDAEAAKRFEQTGSWDPIVQNSRADESWTLGNKMRQFKDIPVVPGAGGEPMGVMHTPPFAGGISMDATGNPTIMPPSPGGFRYFGQNGPIDTSATKPAGAPLALSPTARAAYEAAKSGSTSPVTPQATNAPTGPAWTPHPSARPDDPTAAARARIMQYLLR